MRRKIVSGIKLSLLLIGTLTLALPIGSSHATTTQSVAIDITRLYSYLPSFNLATSALEAEGYIVHVWEDGEITADRLTDYAMLIIVLPQAAYSTSEVAAILDFVNGGHGLLFLGEYGKTWQDLSNGVYPTGADPIIGSLGISINNDCLYDPTDYDPATYMPLIHTFPIAHPVIDGIDLYMPAGSATLLVESPSTVIASGDDDTYAVDPDETDPECDSPPIVDGTGGSYEPVLAASAYGMGRAVVAGDHNWIADEWGGYYDNIQLLVNIVKWLSQDFSISVSPTSRTITPRQTTTYNVTITSINGFNSEVSLSSSTHPTSEDISLTFDSPSVTPPADSSIETTLTVSTTRTVETNFYTLKITCSGGDKTHSTTVTLTIAWYELFFEIDYMEGHRPTDSVLTYIQNYYINEDIAIMFHVNDTVPCDSLVTKDEFWTIENEYNNMGDDWAGGNKSTGVYYSTWKWVLFGATYEEENWNGFCVVPTNLLDMETPALSTKGGNYIFIADKVNDDDSGGLGVTEDKVETVVLMHEMGHSIGILRLKLNRLKFRWEEFYDRDLTSVMANVNSQNCNADQIHYSTPYWQLRDMSYYKV